MEEEFMNKLDPAIAFRAMSFFLENYYREKESDGIGSLLGDIQLHDDGIPFDAAAWDEWLDFWEKARSRFPSSSSEGIAFRAMSLFLQNYYEGTSADDVGFLVSELLIADGKPVVAIVWDKWLKSIREALLERQSTSSEA